MGEGSVLGGGIAEGVGAGVAVGMVEERLVGRRGGEVLHGAARVAGMAAAVGRRVLVLVKRRERAGVVGVEDLPALVVVFGRAVGIVAVVGGLGKEGLGSAEAGGLHGRGMVSERRERVLLLGLAGPGQQRVEVDDGALGHGCRESLEFFV